MKGIVLAGGSGTRLYPVSRAVSKQLLPVYDKPAIYYPISTLMLGGIREIVVISTPRDLPMIEGLLGDGKKLGISLSYHVQPKPEGIAQAFLLTKDFIQGSSVALILGDNLFYGDDLGSKLAAASKTTKGARVFAYQVQDPQRYGVVEFGADGKAKSIVEKPKRPRSNWAVTGLYFYDNQVVEHASSLRPSARGELEITDLNQRYLDAGQLHVETIGRGVAWLDVGTPDSLLAASSFVQTLESRQGLKIACLEEIAYSRGFIDAKQFTNLVEEYPESPYGNYLRRFLAMEETR